MAIGLEFVTHWSQKRTVLLAIKGCLSGAKQAKNALFKICKCGFFVLKQIHYSVL